MFLVLDVLIMLGDILHDPYTAMVLSHHYFQI